MRSRFWRRSSVKLLTVLDAARQTQVIADIVVQSRLEVLIRTGLESVWVPDTNIPVRKTIAMQFAPNG